MIWKVELTDEAKAELGSLDNSVQKSVAAGLIKLNESPHLRGHSLTGNLSGYRALAVGKKKIRIIYRIEHDQVLVVVIAIGRRRNSEVYDAAGERVRD